MRKFYIIIGIIGLACVIFGGTVLLARGGHQTFLFSQSRAGASDGDKESQDPTADGDEELPAATSVPVTTLDIQGEPQDASALGGYNVLIADRGNNRLIEVTPDKKIIWQYRFSLPKPGLGADDSFFTDNGNSIIVNLEEYHVIQIINYASKQVTWSYGTAGHPGAGTGYLNTPDDAYRLPNGDVTVADIKNCRILEIAPGKNIVRQYGITGKCGNGLSQLDKPNGDTPLPNGHTFISNIVGRNLLELDQNWQPVFTMPLPVKYPSDPQLTRAGNILISDYSNPGQIVEVSRQGKIIWKFSGQAGDVKLNHPSLAIELPNGNILANDDLNHRVIVINKQTGKIVWQYGVTRKPGAADGQLNIPDGLDIILSKPGTPALSVGAVSRHAGNYLGQTVTITGYVLEQQNGYSIISDESAGAVGPYDLPVTGQNIAGLAARQKYTFRGIIKNQGLNSSNNNIYHLELLVPAQ
ncbi:MAG: hypothetical protein P4L74_04410 [Candidatus Doudnabacteria bacterium]|nr:hypothetical protein [Candidatus Doudnabacteria bacterium]